MHRACTDFPLRATQSFDTATMAITNGIYVGDLALLRFYGSFEWLEERRRLEFDFDAIAVLGFKFDLPKGGAEELGAATGLGAKNNVNRAKSGKKAFFNVRLANRRQLASPRRGECLSGSAFESRLATQWISADADIATARGGGGGLALWRRDEEMESKMRAGEM